MNNATPPDIYLKPFLFFTKHVKLARSTWSKTTILIFRRQAISVSEITSFGSGNLFFALKPQTFRNKKCKCLFTNFGLLHSLAFNLTKDILLIKQVYFDKVALTVEKSWSASVSCKCSVYCWLTTRGNTELCPLGLLTNYSGFTFRFKRNTCYRCYGQIPQTKRKTVSNFHPKLEKAI